eukprot:scaffold45950_cov87-Cyclotella_meneghiniana.AAC.3
MPTTHKIPWSIHEAAGVNIRQFQTDALDKTGVAPTHEQVQQFISSHYKDFFDRKSRSDSENSNNNNHNRPNNNNNISKNPIYVKCGHKHELHPALELLGPSIQEREGQVYVQWGTSGLKEYVKKCDVVRELQSRSRTKTNRYEPPDEEGDGNKKPRAKRKSPIHKEDNAHFLPIKDTGLGSVDGSSDSS